MLTYQEAQLDALGDPTRRAILARLLDGPMPVGELARGFPVTRPAISQHLRVLKQANLVTDKSAGNRRLYQVNPEGFESLREYFDQFWSQALSVFKQKAELPIKEAQMGAIANSAADRPVRKSIIVNAGVEHTFRVFTEGIDTWWPRTHHIGKSPMKKAIIEGRSGGRCYSEQIDGTECDWGQVLAWEPPSRCVIAWQITPQWQYEPDVSKSSEVEVRFIPESAGSTRVELEHRYFSRHGAGGETMRTAIDSTGGWDSLLQLFAAKAEREQ